MYQWFLKQVPQDKRTTGLAKSFFSFFYNCSHQNCGQFLPRLFCIKWPFGQLKTTFCKHKIKSWLYQPWSFIYTQYTFCFFWRCGIPSAACTAGLLAICCANLRFCCVDCWLADNVARTSCADGGGGLIFCICVNLDGNGGRTSQFLSHYNQASSNYHT